MFEAVEARLRSAYPSHEWIPVTHGMSGALTYRLAGLSELFVKLARVSAHPDPRADVLAEARRLEWLTAKGFPAAKVVDAGASGAVRWLVMTAVPGRPASDPWPVDQRMRVIDSVAEILRALHALPVSDCPFDRTLDVALGNVRRALDEGLFERGVEEMDQWERDLDRRGLLAELERTRPPMEDLAVCHGDYCLPNVMIDPETLTPTGLVDLGRLGRADRYADLALMCRSIGSETMNPQYGQSHVARFLTEYGANPSDPRLDYYARLDWLF
ncbi:APH(3') family aminoglycoside O-phosphotransferase [Flindersiella endophytica]